MKKRFLACLLVVCLLVCFAPAAFAAEGDAVPQVANMSIAYDGTDIVKENANGSLVFTATGNTQVVDYTATVTLGDGAEFTPTTPGVGDLYVDAVTGNSVTLKFNVPIEEEENKNLSDYEEFDLTLTKGSGNTWTGGFADASILKLNMLAGYLTDKTVQVGAGALGTNSPAQRIIVNEDDNRVMLILCAPNAVTNTVTYIIGSNTIVWELPQGMNMPLPEIGDETIAWYTDADHSTGSEFVSGTVTGDTTLYGVIDDGTTPTGNFYDDLTNHRTATIQNLTDFETFVAYSDQAQAGQLIQLGANIECQGNSYPAMEFAGNFDGCGFKISDATFEATTNTPSGEECSGMFSTLGHGQIVANLTLEDIDVEYAAQYAGALVGMADGWSGDEVLIQNVQVRNCGVSGRSAGGVIGFARNADVIFCSSRDTRVTGVANGGGVVGLSNTVVQFCYSTSTPTALPSLLGGCAGGVVGKNVRGAYTEYCWATMKVVGGGGENPGTDVGDFEVDPDNTTIEEYEAKGYNQNGNEYWILDYGDATDFDPEAVEYTFASNS